MKKIYYHYKFKALRLLAILGLTFPLRHSLSSNAGMFILVFSAMELFADEPLVDHDICLLIGFAGLFLSMDMVADAINNYTIED